jgi:hypothetical protein
MLGPNNSSMNRTGRKCPRCGCEFVSHSHRRLLERMCLRILGLAPFRCDSCDRRFYQRSTKEQAAASEPVASGSVPPASALAAAPVPEPAADYPSQSVAPCDGYLLAMQKQRPLPSGSATANSRSPQV